MAGILDNFQRMGALLSCPVCFEIPELGGTVLCRNGHSACESCALKIKKCRKCNGCFTSTKNILAEILIQECTWPCDYEENGCTEKITLRDKYFHAEICEYRPIICKLFKHTDLIFGSCEEVVSYTNYLEHACNKHMGTVAFEDNTSGELNQSLPYELTSNTEITWGHCPPIHFMYTLESAKTNDYFVVVTDMYDLSFYWWVCYLKPEFMNCWSTITLQSPISKRKLSFTGPMHSIRVSPDEVINSGICLSASRDTLKSIANYCPVTCTTKWIVAVEIECREVAGNPGNCLPGSPAKVEEVYGIEVTSIPGTSVISPPVFDKKDSSKSSEYEFKSTSSSPMKSTSSLSLKEPDPAPVSTPDRAPISAPDRAPISTPDRAPVSTLHRPPVLTLYRPPVSTLYRPPVSTPTSVSSSAKYKPLLDSGLDIIHIAFEANDVEGVGLCIIRNSELTSPVFFTFGPKRHGLRPGLGMSDYCIANAKIVIQEFAENFSPGGHIVLQTSMSTQLNQEQKAEAENYLVTLMKPSVVNVTFRTSSNKTRKQLIAVTEAAVLLLEHEVAKCKKVLRDFGICPGEIVYVPE